MLICGSMLANVEMNVEHRCTFFSLQFDDFSQNVLVLCNAGPIYIEHLHVPLNCGRLRGGHQLNATRVDVVS